MMEKREATKIGDSENAQESLPVKPKFSADFPEAVGREGVDELTLRREEEVMLRTFIDTTNVGGPPLVDGDLSFVKASAEASRERNG